jgi:poly-D-alanine transfer protein DltD
MLTRVFKAGWTATPNEIFNSNKLSWKAKGLWGYINSKDENYDFAKDRITKDATDGEKSTSSGLKELVDHGLLEFKPKFKGNKLAGQDYILYDTFGGSRTPHFRSHGKQETPNLGDTQKGGYKLIKNITKKEETKKESTNEELKRIIEIWNEKTKSKLKSIHSISKHYPYWREIYDFDDIQSSLEEFAKDPFWVKQGVDMLFRKEDSKGNPVDRIAKYLPIKKEEQRKNLTLQDLGL